MVAVERITRNYRDVRGRIAAAAARAGREAGDVTLVAVTKTVDSDAVRILYELGQRDFGENRLQAALPRIEAAPGPDCRWHMIGHLQRNKVKRTLECFGLIHSLDSSRLAAEINRRAAERGERRDVLIEVNVSGEARKYGIAPGEAAALLAATEAMPGVRVVGLMTMLPYGVEPDAARALFREVRALRDELRAAHRDVRVLSMGMSQDYEIAVEEGADLVRVGTALFR